MSSILQTRKRGAGTCHGHIHKWEASPGPQALLLALKLVTWPRGDLTPVTLCFLPWWQEVFCPERRRGLCVHAACWARVLRGRLCFSFFFFSNSSWNTIDLQYPRSFRCTAKWFRYTYASINIFFFRFFSLIGLYKMLSRVPCAIQ